MTSRDDRIIERKLTLSDIADVRAYERERDGFRRRIIALKKRRRVSVGPFVTFVFENRDTVRFQIQEMARAEKLVDDEAIERELRVYNPLIPNPGELSATMFIELTSPGELREWLPKLVGIETAPQLRLSGLGGRGGLAGLDAPASSQHQRIIACSVDPEHQQQLSRETMTASVHYVRFWLDADARDSFAAGPVVLAIDHPNYRHEVALSPETKGELQTDLAPSAPPAL